MGDHHHHRMGVRQFPPNNEYLNCNPNPYINAPPLPFPPRFPPPNMPLMPPHALYPPPCVPCYPPQPMPPPTYGGRPVDSSSCWDSGKPVSDSTLSVTTQQPFLGNPLTQDSENVQEWVDVWVKNRAKSRNVGKTDIKIYAVREKLDAALKLVREIENSSRTLGVMVKTVSIAEWAEKCKEVELKKETLISLFNEIHLSEADSKLLKEKLSKRQKKRARLHRQSERLKQQKEDEKVKEQNLNFQIDNWRREMQEGVERIKREEELKKEADAVLWGVTQKKTEAKRQVAMLSALLTLRSARVARLSAAGLPVSQSQIDTFNTVIERLKSMWSHQLGQCQLEEQALRGMLGVEARPPDALQTHKRLVLHEWETAIFGSIGTADTSLPPDQLIEIRCAWDRFAVREPSLLASAVPPGYVLPVPPSSDQWRSFLKY